MNLPNVITSNHSIDTWNRSAISSELSRDCAFYREITGKECNIDVEHVAQLVEDMVGRIDLDMIDSATIRGLVATALFQEGHTDLSRYSSRVGIPARNAWGIIRGSGDWDNANLTPGPETSHKLGADALFKDLYSRILPEHIMQAHADGAIHIHDLDYFMTRIFCKSWDLRYTFYYGLKPDGTGENAIAAGPAMHADVAILQACKVLGLAQCNCAGGQGLLHGTVFLAPYMEGMSYEEIYQYMQMIFYELNQMYVSRGGQPCFSSINLNPGVPKILENAPVVYKGKVWQDKKYGDYEREVRLMFKACMELSLKGDDNGRMFPFPKLEVSAEPKFCDEKTWDQEFEDAPSYKSLYELAFQVVAKYGTLYFDNMLPEKRKAETSVACMQCCAYQFVDDSETDINFHDRLNFVDGKHFDLGGMQAGSINLPRIAYKADHSDKAFLLETFRVMDILAEMFLCKKTAILQTQSRLQFLTQTPTDRNNGLPGDRYVDFNGLVYEVGIVGLNEAMKHHTGKQLHESDLKFAKLLLSSMGDYCKILSQKHGIKIVLARTPAETTAQRFAASDLVRYPEFAKAVIKGDLEHANGKNPAIYYSNGFAPDVAADIGIFERLKIENELWPFVDGGAITHIWLGEANPDPKGLMDFAFRVFRNTNIGYLAFTKDLSQCATCKHIEGGIVKKCPKCGSDQIDWYSRITGYYSKVGSQRGTEVKAKWNAAKVAEWERRNRVTI